MICSSAVFTFEHTCNLSCCNRSQFSFFELASRIKVDCIIMFLFLQWAGDDEADVSVNRKVSSACVVEAEVWYGVVIFSTLLPMHQIVR